MEEERRWIRKDKGVGKGENGGKKSDKCTEDEFRVGVVHAWRTVCREGGDNAGREEERKEAFGKGNGRGSLEG